MSAAEPSTILISGLIGALVSAIINVVFNAWNADRKIRTARRLLAVEIEVCAAFAKTFCEARIYAPLYRLPLAGFNTALRELVGSGELSEEKARALIEFYSEVETLNRGLDLVADTLPKALQAEVSTGEIGTEERKLHSRNLIKAERIKAPDGSLYLKAREPFA
jgi:hypothetical protein